MAKTNFTRKEYIPPPKDDREAEMRKGADSVMNAEGSMASVFCTLPPEVERLIGKLTTYTLLFDAAMRERFDVFSDAELKQIGEAGAKLCYDLTALSKTAYDWNYLHGHIIAELSRRRTTNNCLSCANYVDEE